MKRHSCTTGGMSSSNGNGRSDDWEEHDQLQEEVASCGELNVRAHERSLRTSSIPPPEDIETETIRAAAVGKMPGGVEHVKSVHEARFDLGCALERNRLTEHHEILKDFLRRTKSLQGEIRKRLTTTDRHLAVPDELVPWNRFDLLKLTFYASLSLAAMAVGVNQLRVVLIASGYFESDFDATLFSFLPLGIAAVIESLEGFMPSDRSRKIYVRSVHVCALVTGTAWVWVFVLHFGEGMTGAAEFDPSAFLDLGENASSSEESSGDAVGVWLLRTSIAGEIFVASSMWLAIAGLAAKHAPSRPVVNPVFQSLEKLLTRLSRESTIAADLFGRFKDRLEEIEHGRTLYVASAVDQYQLAVSALENTALLSDHLRPASQTPSSKTLLEETTR